MKNGKSLIPTVAVLNYVYSKNSIVMAENTRVRANIFNLSDNSEEHRPILFPSFYGD